MQAATGGTADPRLDERSNVFLGASLHCAAGTFPVRIRNISTMGAMLDGANLPGEGTHVDLQRGSLAITGEVAWQAGAFRGVRFDGQIAVDDWVKRGGHGGQQRVDRTVAALRVGMAAAASNFSEIAAARSVEELSDELLRICERMASSAGLTVEIGEEVLKIELIALSLRRLGSQTQGP